MLASFPSEFQRINLDGYYSSLGDIAAARSVPVAVAPDPRLVDVVVPPISVSTLGADVPGKIPLSDVLNPVQTPIKTFTALETTISRNEFAAPNTTRNFTFSTSGGGGGNFIDPDAPSAAASGGFLSGVGSNVDPALLYLLGGLGVLLLVANRKG